MASRSTRAPRTTSTPAPAPAPAPAPTYSGITLDANVFAIVADSIRKGCADDVILHMVADVVRNTTDEVDFITGFSFPADYVDGIAQLCAIADTAFNTGKLDRAIIRSIHRGLTYAQPEKVRVASELSAVKRDARRAGRNLRK